MLGLRVKRPQLRSASIFSPIVSEPDSVDPNAFIAEVYRRMSARHAAGNARPTWQETENQAMVLNAAHQYAPHLPKDRSASILDIGFGSGWFVAACLKLGYEKIYGADFGIDRKQHVRDWAPGRITLFDISNDVGDFLSDKKEQYDFIHLSHVIEHVPKYSLLWVVDGIYWALKPGGTLLVRTPNMEGPCANSTFYVTLSHEYGFAASNLMSLLDICGFDDLRLINFSAYKPDLKQRLGKLLRWPILQQSRFLNRLFGENCGGQFGDEINVVAKRGAWPPYFDRHFK
jgi:2-polyprenyl-3-methyl-5-hydroxy-6-metoxy-1,4-benzoquinol methylase